MYLTCRGALILCVCVCLERNDARPPAPTTVRGATHTVPGVVHGHSSTAHSILFYQGRRCQACEAGRGMSAPRHVPLTVKLILRLATTAARGPSYVLVHGKSSAGSGRSLRPQTAPRPHPTSLPLCDHAISRWPTAVGVDGGALSPRASWTHTTTTMQHHIYSQKSEHSATAELYSFKLTVLRSLTD